MIRRRTSSMAAARRGFTAMELMLGMLVTALVMGAVTAVMTAVSKGWSQSTSTESASNTTVQSHVRMLRTLKQARQIGTTRTGSVNGNTNPGAAVMLWKGDANLDSRIQFSELAMLEHDTSNDKLIQYEVEFPSSWTAAQKTAADTPALADDDIYASNVIETFKALTNVVGSDLAKNVTGVEFRRNDSYGTVRPTLEYLLRFDRNGTIETEYGTVAVRVPATMPVSQR